MHLLDERIAQFRKMANDDPDNELGHYRLGQLLQEAGRLEEAVQAYRRTLELSPQFSKVYQLLGECLKQLGQRADAIKVLREGFAVADERGDYVPRDAMSKLLVELGEPAPVPRPTTPASTAGQAVGGFRCRRPGCYMGQRARQLPKAPLPDDIGQKIFENVCAECWNYWLRDLSIKVINEMRLDLSTAQGAEIYDQIMRETLGLS
ncbi:MAG: Fe(2+)-trafficking protein [Gemmataceae bacterium]|nr:Fe(2+)-trafficking protein [Gemmataceae bacterium]